MTIHVGEKVYYVGRGPCMVAEVVSKVVCGASARFYKFIVLGGGSEEFLVPVAQAGALPLRSLTAFNKIPELLGHLKTRLNSHRELGTWRERESIRSKIFASGSPFDLGDFIGSLTRASGVRKLAVDELEALRRARKLLIAEIAEVMGESLSAAELRVDSLLDSDRVTTAKTARGEKLGARAKPANVIPE